LERNKPQTVRILFLFQKNKDSCFFTSHNFFLQAKLEKWHMTFCGGRLNQATWSVVKAKKQPGPACAPKWAAHWSRQASPFLLSAALCPARNRGPQH
jgi:hypothetical protein